MSIGGFSTCFRPSGNLRLKLWPPSPRAFPRALITRPSRTMSRSIGAAVPHALSAPGLLHEASFHTSINFVAQFMDGTLFSISCGWIGKYFMWNWKAIQFAFQSDLIWLFKCRRTLTACTNIPSTFLGCLLPITKIWSRPTTFGKI